MGIAVALDALGTLSTYTSRFVSLTTHVLRLFCDAFYY